MEENYSADSIQVLEGLSAVRKRPSMYIGDVGLKGFHHLFWEILDNSIDEFLAGYCKNIMIRINTDNSVTIIDDGRGIPTDIHSVKKKSALEIVMTVLHSGGKFNNKNYKISGGLHGVGLSCVNALSEFLKVEVFRGKKKFFQEYKLGIPISKVKCIGSSFLNGTKITFRPDKGIFGDLSYNYDIIFSRLNELSYLNNGLKIYFEDARINKIKIFYSKGGIIEFLKYLDNKKNNLIPNPIFINEKKNNIFIQVVFNYNTLFSENIISYINNINTVEGGTHVSGFKKALTRTLKNYAEKFKLLEKSKLEINGEDFREGLTAIISVKLNNPQFEGQTKMKLSNSEVLGVVDTCVSKSLYYFLEENPKFSKSIISKIILSAKARYAAKKAREIVHKKNSFIINKLPGKLSDCSSKNPFLSEIFIVEGDSAGGTAKQGRYRKFQAILPLRGKIINVEKTKEYKIYENEQIRNIINALGIVFKKGNNKKFNIDKLRYHKIIIMTDADIDGSHIRTLVLTFFFRYMFNLIINGYLYIALPPLYLVSNNLDYKYCWTENERNNLIKLFSSFKRNHILNIQRYKGLGEMNSNQLWNTTMNPKIRNIKLVIINSIVESDYLFSTLMGEDVFPRKDFIEKNYKHAKINI